MLGQAWRHFRDSLQVFAKFIVTILICCSQSLHICTIRRHNPFFLPHSEAHSLQHHNSLPDSSSQSFFSQSFCLCTTQIHNPCHIHSHFVQNICFVAVFLSLIFIPILKSIFANFIILVLTVFVSSALLIILCYSRCKGSPPQGSSSGFTITESFN